jgi:G3E family GTPase
MHGMGIEGWGCRYSYDRIIIELSGVAEPKNIRREFVEAAGNVHACWHNMCMHAHVVAIHACR